MTAEPPTPPPPTQGTERQSDVQRHSVFISLSLSLSLSVSWLVNVLAAGKAYIFRTNLLRQIHMQSHQNKKITNLTQSQYTDMRPTNLTLTPQHQVSGSEATRVPLLPIKKLLACLCQVLNSGLLHTQQMS